LDGYNGVDYFDPVISISESSDDQQIVSYSIDWGNGGSLTEGTDYLTNISAGPVYMANSGSYTITVTITDNEGLTGTATLEFDTTVDVPNSPPSAVIRLIDEGLTGGTEFFPVFTLADSTDDKGIVDYVFKWGSGYGTTFGEDISVELTPSVGYPINTGVVTIEVTVTDGDGAFSNASYEFDTSRPINHDGDTYYTVISPHTNRMWLDRNIGASQVCQSYADVDCAGGHFQFGRSKDGHELHDSAENATRFADLDSTTNEFVFGARPSAPNTADWTTADSDGSTRLARWNSVDGSSICPNGFRLPTIEEWIAEVGVDGADIGGHWDAFNSFLALPNAGRRLPYLDGSGNYFNTAPGTDTFYWSSEVSGTSQQQVYYFNASESATFFTAYWDEGGAVRCIAD
jgi:uncharacterized protein (TIGR02145 family)